ncbi:MAG TPA: sugar ABC transporter permease [Phycisphaerae bacterium]|nr:sugar ABC transporter permease [Phycisphaerae bacterium]
MFCTFALYPMIKSLVLAFFITSGPKSQVFAGFSNFAFMLTDASFGKAVVNTAVFALFSVFLQLPLSLGLALLLNAKFLRMRGLFRFAFFAPSVVGSVFVGVLFSVIFAPRLGLLNQVLSWMALVPANTAWLQKAHLVMPALVITALWMYVGFNMIYFLAALQAVDKNLYDAAAVDGADAIQRFRHVTLPGIKPVAILVVVMSTIGSFQLFELAYLMLQNTAGPEQAGLTVVMYLYQKGFEAGDLGYASVVGWTLALGVLVVSLGQLALAGTWKKAT